MKAIEVWPRNLTEIVCPNIDCLATSKLSVVQTTYGARVICYSCSKRWTTLFSEPTTWVEESYSPMEENVAQGREPVGPQTQTVFAPPPPKAPKSKLSPAASSTGDECTHCGIGRMERDVCLDCGNRR